MSNEIEIGFSNFNDVEKLIDNIIKNNLKNETENDFENELEEIFNEEFVENGLSDYLNAFKEDNKSRPKMLNPKAVQKAAIIKKAISEIKNEIEYNNDCEIKIKEELSSGFRWDYILKMRTPLINFIQILNNPVFNLFKIAVLSSDTMEFPITNDLENEFEINFNVYDIYKIL
jgi:hypothetical protein